ncbi:ion transporter [Longispora sp. NPDC051575]|uniref:ion transporter n=1 Tax=Longispora sp. NPDC051575 TaxID=3154943 RepID=UPI003444E2BE
MLTRRIVAVCAQAVEAPWFHTVSAAVIVLNAVVLAVETYQSAVDAIGPLLTFLDTACLTFFVLELATRFVACGKRPQDFFANPWNIFDLVVVLLAFTPGVRENATLLRLARLARVLRVIRIFPTMRILARAVWRSLPGAASLLVMGMIMLFLYGMLGWMLFSERLPEQYGSIGQAVLTLFFLMVFDNLTDTVRAGMAVSPWTVLYFVSFVLLAGFLMVNILLGVVLNSLDEARTIELAENDEAPRPSTGPPPLAERLAALRISITELEAEVAATEAGREREEIRA